MKVCFKCKAEKAITEFYRHPMMADGHLGKCKDCTKRDVRLHRIANIDRVREYDHERSVLPHRCDLRARISDRWKAKHPERRRTVNIANNATRDGQLVPPKACEGCGREVRLEKHHHDYTQPLLVIWLCKPCHAIADKIRRKFEPF